jgi:hypothetical protein
MTDGFIRQVSICLTISAFCCFINLVDIDCQVGSPMVFTRPSTKGSCCPGKGKGIWDVLFVTWTWMCLSVCLRHLGGGQGRLSCCVS